jgi:hypothetical protein
MHKVYLLIRRNKQTGPYTLEELVQLGLQPFDLVWVEGKSAAWAYPSEITALQPYLKKDDDATQKKEEREPRADRAGSEPPKVQPESEPLKVGNEPAAPQRQSSHEAFMPSNSEKVPPAKAPSPKLVYVSHPKNKAPEPTPVKDETPKVNIEQKAEELKRRAESYIPEKKSVEASEPIQTKYARPLNEIEEDFATWTYNKKSRKQIQLPVKTIMSVGLGVLLIAGTYGIAKYAFSTSKAPASKDTVIDNSQNPELTTEKLILETAPAKTVAVEKVPGSSITQDKVPAKVVAEEKAPAPAPKREEKVVSNDRKVQKTTPEVVATKKSPPVNEPKSKQKNATVAPPVVKEEKPATEAVATNTNKPGSEPPAPKNEPVVASTPAKKKSFDEKVDEFINQFKRKKTGEKPAAETTVEDPQPSVANTGTAERKARRRDEEPAAVEEPQQPSVANTGTAERKTKRRDEEPAPAPEPQHLEEFVEVSSNQPAENWMLGIHNLKLTVSNRSTVPVKKAAVEIRYLNNLNEVIQKRVLNVTNIPAKKSVLVLAPDHRLAERLESRVLSAEGN